MRHYWNSAWNNASLPATNRENITCDGCIAIGKLNATYNPETPATLRRVRELVTQKLKGVYPQHERTALDLLESAGSGEEQRPPAHTVRGGSEAQVEPEARAWIDAHFPREEQEPL